MPRKSVAALSVVTPIQDHRPPAPEDMPEAQAEIWTRTVNRLPHDWFKAEHLPLLRAYVQHVAIAQVIARRIEAFDPDWLGPEGGLERFDMLAKVLEREHKLMVMLARSMRFTHQSQYDRAVAGKQSRDAKSGDWVPPWGKFIT